MTLVSALSGLMIARDAARPAACASKTTMIIMTPTSIAGRTRAT